MVTARNEGRLAGEDSSAALGTGGWRDAGAMAGRAACLPVILPSRSCRCLTDTQSRLFTPAPTRAALLTTPIPPLPHSHSHTRSYTPPSANHNGGGGGFFTVVCRSHTSDRWRVVRFQQATVVGMLLLRAPCLAWCHGETPTPRHRPAHHLPPWSPPLRKRSVALQPATDFRRGGRAKFQAGLLDCWS